MLTKWKPFDDFLYINENFRNLFKARPAVDVYEDKEKFTLEAELPGMSLKDISITLDNNILTIKGEKKFPNEVKGKDYFILERAEGSFTRSFTLPKNTDVDAIDASYKDGVLIVNIPKKPEKKPKEINIRSTS